MTKIDGYELRECPFCGTAEISFSPCLFYTNQAYFVECGNIDCNATGPVDLGKSGAAEKWNERYEVKP